MASTVKKADIKRPVLPKEAVPVESMGGEVIVRGLLFSERMALFAEAGEGAQIMVYVPRLLAMTVIDAEAKPIFSADEWEVFGVGQEAEMLALMQVALRLSGLQGEAVKKS